MEVTSIQNGIIIDHVPAGTALKVLEYLKIDPSKTKLALIMNTDSHMYGTKDIIKIEDETESSTSTCSASWRAPRPSASSAAAKSSKRRSRPCRNMSSTSSNA